MNTLTEEQQKEVEERTAVFLEEYKALIDKHQMDFISFPVFVPNERGSFEVMLQTQPMDKKYAPVPSDFMVKE